MKYFVLSFLLAVATIATTEKASAELLYVGSVVEIRVPLRFEKNGISAILYSSGEVRDANYITYLFRSWCAVDYAKPAKGFKVEGSTFYEYSPTETTVVASRPVQGRMQGLIYTLSNGLELTCDNRHVDINEAFGSVIRVR